MPLVGRDHATVWWAVPTLLEGELEGGQVFEVDVALLVDVEDDAAIVLIQAWIAGWLRADAGHTFVASLVVEQINGTVKV